MCHANIYAVLQFFLIGSRPLQSKCIFIQYSILLIALTHYTICHLSLRERLNINNKWNLSLFQCNIQPTHLRGYLSSFHKGQQVLSFSGCLVCYVVIQSTCHCGLPPSFPLIVFNPTFITKLHTPIFYWFYKWQDKAFDAYGITQSVILSSRVLLFSVIRGIANWLFCDHNIGSWFCP